MPTEVETGGFQTMLNEIVRAYAFAQHSSQVKSSTWLILCVLESTDFDSLVNAGIATMKIYCR